MQLKQLVGDQVQLFPTTEVPDRNRYVQPLPRVGVPVTIEECWDRIEVAPEEAHERVFVEILSRHGLSPVNSPVPLVSRYSKGKRWTHEEFEACFSAYQRGVPLTQIAAALNRNPQDMIFRLMDRCRILGIPFREVSLPNASKRWTNFTNEVALELFHAGLTAWRIAVLFRVDFEQVEKAMFAARKGYGHDKKNPFIICTVHKRLVNREILSRYKHKVNNALNAFAGCGEFTAALSEIVPQASTVSVELDRDVFEVACKLTPAENHRWVNSNNLEEFQQLRKACQKFDCIDLDPFVTCHEQLGEVWHLAHDNCLLLVTFGGEYRRSFIGSNRLAIKRRYGFFSDTLNNRDYLEVVPSYFLGHIAGLSSAHGFVFEVVRAVRYPNNCRFCLDVRRVSISAAQNWLATSTVELDGGRTWRDLSMPRFSEVRHEFEETRVKRAKSTSSKARLETLF